MNQFNFKSQICTTREQSERLLELGLKEETADFPVWGTEGLLYMAWSLHRLCLLFRPMLEDETQLTIPLEDTYDKIIDAFETVIKKGYFNKEYLV